jgi:2,4-diketo-3-deoxy-L-fuconate hydrolase
MGHALEEVLLLLSLDRLKRLDVKSLPLVANLFLWLRASRASEPASDESENSFICIGLNYSGHAAEAGMKVPAEPVIFMKATFAVCGPNENIIPLESTKTNSEVELGVIIGAPAKHISELLWLVVFRSSNRSIAAD